MSKLAMHRSMAFSAPGRVAKIFMYSDLNVSKLAMHRSMGWLSPRRRQRS